MICIANQPTVPVVGPIIDPSTKAILAALDAYDKIDGVDQMPLHEIEKRMDSREQRSKP